MDGPHTIVVIRHGEKPPKEGGQPYGVDENGARNAGSLTPRGWQRAGALVPFLISGSSGVAPPSVIYAAAPKGGGGSSRPYETVIPAAARFTRKRINTSFRRPDTDEMVADLLTQSGVALVCWDHEHIPDIARAILQQKKVPRWPGTRFDLVWLFSYTGGGYRLNVIAQNLLSGDKDIAATE